MVPEIVIQEGVKRAWRFLQDRSYLIGDILRHFRVERQEEYRRFVENTTPSIVFQNPVGTPMLPVFAISLLSESEEQAYLADDGLSVRYTAAAMKYPPPQPEDFEKDGYYGIDYGVPGIEGRARYMRIGGDQGRDESQHHPTIGQNTGIQRMGGDEQYERIDEPQKMFSYLRHHISTLAVQHRIQMGIEINAENAEQCFVLYRLLQTILERFSTWFHVNGVQNPTFSGSELGVNMEYQPTAGGPGAFRRQITMSFQHESRNQEIDAVLAGWMLEVDMITPNNEGGNDETRIATVGPTNQGSKVGLGDDFGD